MRRYKNLFIAQLLALTIISFSSCDFVDHLLDDDSAEAQYDERNQYNNDNEDNTQNDVNSQTDADIRENTTTQSLSNLEDTVPSPATIPVEPANEKNNQNEQDCIISELTNKIGTLESKNARMIESSTVYALMLFNYLLLLILFIYLYRKINACKKRNVNTSFDNSGDGPITHNIIRLLINNRIEELTKQINSKNKKQDDNIQDLDKRLNKLEAKGDPYAGYYAGGKHDNNLYSTSVANTLVSPSNESPDSSSKPNTFYMPRTMIQLQFEDSKKKLSRSENTYFKFIIMKENQAMFMFDPYDDNCFKKAFDDRDNSLATVCEIELLSKQPRSFKNCENGYAELRNGVWEVTKKLKLQYV